jgi:hypothetical protein
MGYQTDLSLQQLSDIGTKLGDQKGILANSWQLLSDPDVKVPNVTKTTELSPRSATRSLRSRDRLPASMLGALHDPRVVWDDHARVGAFQFTVPHDIFNWRAGTAWSTATSSTVTAEDS